MGRKSASVVVGLVAGEGSEFVCWVDPEEEVEEAAVRLPLSSTVLAGC